MIWDVNIPFDALPTLPPNFELETRKVLKATIEARAALAHLDAAAQNLSNPAVIINAIPMLEAQASSAIENIVTTTDELFAADAIGKAIGDSGSPAVRETLRYRSALRAGFDHVTQRPLAAGAALEICSVIRGHRVALRSGEVFIGNPVTRQRIYTPPASVDAIENLLDNWSQFANEGNAPGRSEETLDPIVRMAVAHYQFEAIHPFTDGNGRTGRILNVLMLCEAGLLKQPFLYLSGEIIATKDEYYERLLAVTSKGDWEGWLLYLIEQVRRSGVRTLGLVQSLSNLDLEITEIIREVTGTANADLAAVLMEQPYARVRNVTERCGVSRPTASRWMKGLVAANVLVEHRVGRELLYVNTRMLEVLSGVGER